MFFNKETHICWVYRSNSSMDVGPAVSLLRYAKGDRDCRIMRLIFYLNHQKQTLWGTALSVPLGAKVTGCFWPSSSPDAEGLAQTASADFETGATMCLKLPFSPTHNSTDTDNQPLAYQGSCLVNGCHIRSPKHSRRPIGRSAADWLAKADYLSVDQAS